MIHSGEKYDNLYQVVDFVSGNYLLEPLPQAQLEKDQGTSITQEPFLRITKYYIPVLKFL